MDQWMVDLGMIPVCNPQADVAKGLRNLMYRFFLGVGGGRIFLKKSLADF